MSDTIANRNDDQYSSTMNTLSVEILPVDTSIFPVVWRHLDDDTHCEHPEVCARDTYAKGGAPRTLAE